MTESEFARLSADVKSVQARCRKGFPRHMIDESNDLHADCYGTLGKLLHLLKEERKPERFMEMLKDVEGRGLDNMEGEDLDSFKKWESVAVYARKLRLAIEAAEKP